MKQRKLSILFIFAFILSMTSQVYADCKHSKHEQKSEKRTPASEISEDHHGQDHKSEPHPKWVDENKIYDFQRVPASFHSPKPI